MSDNKYMVPVAIIVAGVIIAGAVFFNGRSGSGPISDNEENSGNPAEIDIEPISEADHIFGNPNAELFLVEYSDFECPYCKTFHATAQQVIDKYGKEGQVAWVYRHFPLAQLHPKAPEEARATECAAELGGNEGFWAMTNRIFEITPSNNGLDLATLPNIAQDVGLDKVAFQECLDDSQRHREAVTSDFQDAQDAGGTGTPFSVLVSKDAYPDEMKDLVSSLITQAGLRPDSLRLGADGHTLAIGGAFDFELIDTLIKAALF